MKKPAREFVPDQMMTVLTTLFDLAELGHDEEDGGASLIDLAKNESAARSRK